MFAAYRHRNRLKRLIEDWIKYRSVVGARVGAEDVSSEEEHGFLRLKGRIVENLAAITPGLASQGPAQDITSNHRGMSDFLARRPSLAVGEPLSDREREEFEREWHRYFLFLNRLKGLPPQSKPKAAGSPIKAVPAPSPFRSPGLAGLGWLFRFVLRLALIVAAIWVLAAIVPWQRITGGRSSRFIPDSWGSLRDAVTGFQFPTLGGIFDPVVQRYGPELTSIMVAVLLVLLSYWLFVRSK